MGANILFATHFNVSNLFHSFAAAYDSEADGRGMMALMSSAEQLPWDSIQWHTTGFKREDFDLSGRFAGLSKARQLAELRSVIKEFRVDLGVTTAFTAPFFRALRVPYIYFVYGSDLDVYAFQGVDAAQKVIPRVVSLTRRILPPVADSLSSAGKWASKTYLRWGMAGADATIFAPHQKALIEKVGYKRRCCLPHCLGPEFFELTQEDKAAAAAQIKGALRCGRIFFSAARHMWTRNFSDVRFYKGNNVLIEAFKKYLDHTNDAGARLVLVEKGPNVEDSKALIKELNISQKTVWIGHQRKTDLIRYYMAADAAFDQFDDGILAFSAIEPLACWTPAASYIGENNIYGEPPPIINSKDTGEIASFMAKIAFEGGYAKRLGSESREWAERNCTARNFAKTLENMASLILGGRT